MAYSRTDAALKSNHPDITPGAPIETDRPCPKCGYNLIGLTLGGICPECGRRIFFGVHAQPLHHLADAPLWFIRMTQAALWMVLLAVVGAGGATVASSQLGVGARASALVFGVASLVWLTGLALLAIRRPSDRAEGVRMPQINSTLKEATLVSQAMWPIAAALLASGSSAAWVDIATVTVAVFAGLGVIAAMMFLAQVAEFIGDSDRARRLTVIVIVLVASVGLWMMGLRLRVGIPLGSFSMLTRGVSILAPIIIITTGFLLWDLFQLAITGGWATQVARRQDDRVARLRERLARDRAAGRAEGDCQPFGGPVQAPIGSLMGIKPTKRS